MRTFSSLLLLTILIPAFSPRAGAQEETVAPVAQRQVSIAPEGPWGQLEFYEVPLEFPTELLTNLTIPSQYVEWIFEAATHEEMDSNLLVAGLTPAEITASFTGCTIIQDEDILRVYPTDEAVLSMPLATRLPRSMSCVKTEPPRP